MAKIIFFFLKGDPYSKAKTITSGFKCNLGDGEDLQAPCKLKLVGQIKFIDLLQDELTKLTEILTELRCKTFFFFTFCCVQCFNHLMPGGNKKVTYT